MAGGVYPYGHILTGGGYIDVSPSHIDYNKWVFTNIIRVN